jgi:hypothetical protein
MWLHDYSVRSVISRSEGFFVLNVGKWQAKLGGQPLTLSRLLHSDPHSRGRPNEDHGRDRHGRGTLTAPRGSPVKGLSGGHSGQTSPIEPSMSVFPRPPRPERRRAGGS